MEVPWRHRSSFGGGQVLRCRPTFKPTWPRLLIGVLSFAHFSTKKYTSPISLPAGQTPLHCTLAFAEASPNQRPCGFSLRVQQAATRDRRDAPQRHLCHLRRWPKRSHHLLLAWPSHGSMGKTKHIVAWS